MKKKKNHTSVKGRYTKKPIEGKDWILLIRANDQRAMKELYNNHLQPFISWAGRKFPYCSREDIEDVYHDAYLQLYTNVLEGRLTDLWVKIGVYLFAIGKNMLRKRVDDFHSNNLHKELEDSQSCSILPAVQLKYQREYIHWQVHAFLAELSPTDKKLLELAYIYAYSTSAIAEALNVNNEVAIRVRKARALKKLRKRCSIDA